METEKLALDIAQALQQAMATPGFSVDDYLDDRDAAPFDPAWSHAHAGLQKTLEQRPEPTRQAIEKGSAALREPVFKQVMGACGSPDLAASLSDDAGLILEATLAGFSSGWIDALRRCYASHRLPCGALDA
ncbi:hypothetical protein [Variovorax sp. 38R]|uniref:hypothetical protein n=2 Tax=Variovorax TaxID=34072 RepID=UPI0017825EB1|nr:hypothetical protein [Variovorax sp. 38R]QOF79339.1 hypothetical protein IG196_02735 [Variovorax sp. 38R]